MDRRTFLKMYTLLGLGSVTSAGLISPATARFKGKVIIIGAGAAGLAAGFHLKKLGIDFTILEASGRIGGRMKTSNDFADFPIPLGSEWLHTRPGVLAKIAGRGASMKTAGYKGTESYHYVSDGEVEATRIGSFGDRVFVDGSWLDFFNRFIVPSIRSNIRLGQAVRKVSYGGDKVRVETGQGANLAADAVLVTVPLKMVQKGTIAFSPPLPAEKQRAIRSARSWQGLKLFIEFSQKFYPDFFEFEITPSSAGQKMYYDATHAKNSNRNILGLFTVGEPAQPFIRGNAFRVAMAELDQFFDGQASRHYRKHIVQNWATEPHIQSAYLRDDENYRTVRALSKPVGNRIFFAGEAYTDGEDWASVHAAALSAVNTVNKFVRSQ